MNKLEIGFLVKRTLISRNCGILVLLLMIFAHCKERRSPEPADVARTTTAGRIDSAVARANKQYYADDYSGAVKSFSFLIDLDSSKGEYYYKRGFSYAKLLLRRQAVVDFQKSITLNFKPASSCFNIGINSSFDDDSVALVYFRKCLEFDPSYSKAKTEIDDCEYRLKHAKGKPK